MINEKVCNAENDIYTAVLYLWNYLKAFQFLGKMSQRNLDSPYSMHESGYFNEYCI